MSSALRALLFVVLLLVMHGAGAQTRAWLDRDRIALGETTTLNVETDANGAPDYAPLLADFDLSGQASQQQLQWVNGRASSRSLYAVALRPKRAGLVRIPPLRVGGAATAALTLLVTDAPAPVAARGGDDVFIESEADAQDPYVQQSVGWVVRLYSAIPLIAGQLDQPEPQGATLRRVGDDVQFRRNVGNRSYVVTERRYLLIPERSGELVVPPARFSGRGTGNAFDRLFGDGQEVLQATGRPRVLRVRPIPADAPQPWLPLRALTLRYLALPGRATAGRAVTVQVEVEADGASTTQLPALSFPPVAGVQVFPERPQSDESMVDGRPQVRLQRRFAIVPSAAGTVVLPGPRIDWWDTRAGVARSTQLAPLTLEVAPGAAPPAPTDAPATGVPSGASPSARARPWRAALVLGALLLAGFVAYRWRAGARPAAAPAPVVAPGVSHEQAPAGAAPEPPPHLPRLLEHGDLADIDAALRQLAGVRDLDGVVRRLADPAQRDAVERLRLARWAGGDAAEARARLRSAFATGPRWIPAEPVRRDDLPPLYPER